MIFLLTVGWNYRNFLTEDAFQHSRKMVSLQTLAAFANEMIKPPSFDDTPPDILTNMKCYPWFRDCINCVSVINGTYIHAVSPTKKIVLYKFERKKMNAHEYHSYLFIWLVFDAIRPGWKVLSMTRWYFQRQQRDRN